MGLYAVLTDEITEVDVIIAGGGTAGCVIASRLADADKQLSILVVEGGPDNFGLATVTHPALYRATLAPGTANALYFKSRKEEQLSSREVVSVTGGLLGGSSSVNGMIYQRGQSCDFDSWGTKGWSGKDVLPFLKKFETYDGGAANNTHGCDGPMHVSSGQFCRRAIEYDFIAATKRLGYPEVQDLEDLETANAVSSLRGFVSPTDGKRQDAAHAYLHPRLQAGEHPNLNVLVGSQVVRVMVDQGKRATGVEFRPNPALMADPTAEKPPHRVLRARKMVIVTAGAFGTPGILERSGIGDQEVLQRANVPVLAHLPGVGHDYQDHQASLYTYRASMPPEDNWESVHDGARKMAELIESNDEILSWNGADASAKMRPTELEAESLGPRFRQSWDRDFKPVPSKPLVSMILFTGILGNPQRFRPGEYFTICSYTTYPYSRGHVHITGPSLNDAMDFRTGYLSDQDDVDIKAHVWAYKKQRSIARGMHSFGGELRWQHPAFAEGSKASLQKTAGNGVAAEIEYGPEDDIAIEAFLRARVGTAWHPLGTCKMAPVEQMGVVDENLSVHGVKGLKVADLSIAPKNVAGNTMSTALMIGEKAADILIRELGLSN